jgi:hypothetical protein
MIYPGTPLDETPQENFPGTPIEETGEEAFPGTPIEESDAAAYPGTPLEPEDGLIKRAGREIVEQAKEIGTQAAAGVTRDLPKMLLQTAQAVLPGAGPSPTDPQGSGAAGFAGQTVEEIAQREQNATWDDSKKSGWAGVPGMAARSLAPNLLVALATAGKGVAVMPAIYGGSRAQEVFSRLREKAFADGTEFDAGTARLNAFGAGALEGGLEYLSNLFGMNRQIRALMGQLAKPGAQAAAEAAPKLAATVAQGLRKLAGTMAAEGGTEFVQEGGGQLHEQLLGISQMIEEQPASIADVNWQAVWDQAKLAAAAGALGSAAVGGVHAAVRRAQETRDARGERLKAEGGRQKAEDGGQRTEDGGQRTEDGGPQEDNATMPQDGLAQQAEIDDAENQDALQPAAETDGAGGGEATAAATPGADFVPRPPTQAQLDAAGVKRTEDGERKPEDGGQRTELTPEQEEEATRKAEANAKKDYAKAKAMGGNVSDALLESNPAKAMVLELGGIRMDGTEDQRGIPAAYRSRSDKGQTLDQMLTELQRGTEGAKYADWTADDLIEALKGNEAEKRKRFSANPQNGYAEKEWLQQAWTVAPENLAIGFGFTVKGVPYRVADSDETGYVIVRADGKDAGWAIRLDHGKMMNIDGGTLTNAKGAKVSKIKNYADPEQVRVWQEAGADEAAQAGEGYAAGEDEDQPFRTANRGRRTEDGGRKTEDGRQRTEDGKKQLTSLQSTAKPVAQVRLVRRGYDEQREAADDPQFSQWAQNPVDLPELVEMATDLLDGKVPRILKRVDPAGQAAGSVKFKGEQNAAGQAVFGRPEVITLLAANYKLVSDDETEQMQAEAERQARELTGEDGEQRTEDGEQKVKELTASIFDKLYMDEVRARIPKGPRFAMAVIGHEIGHIADQAAKYGMVKPDRSKGKNRLNLIGRVAGMLSWTRDVLADDPSGKTLSADEIRTLQGRARKNAKPDTRGKELMRAITEKWASMPELNALAANPELANLVNARSFRDALEYMAREKPVLSEWFSITTFPEQIRATLKALQSLTAQSKTARQLGSAWFRAEFVKGIEAQRQAHLGKMYSELESLIAWWNNGDRTMMDKYYERPAEMFAEAFGVYLNNPRAVAKRAPMFWRTLLDYMSARPEVQEWLDAFNQDMARGPHAKFDVRDARLTDMFGRARREQNRALEQAGQAGVTRRVASDAARYMLSRKSGPLHALIKTADALGMYNLTNRVSKWADQVENVAALEKAFAAETNEIGDILLQGGLTVEDFDKWAYLNMVAKSPAYTDLANPLGFHPQAAREQLDFLRRQIGDARANQLQKAVERFQTLWLANVVDRMEGMYDDATMAKLRANPMYFTLMVGMDDAEIRTFQTAMQNLDADQMLAYAQRTIERSAFGQPVPGGIIRRVGTHRPAMSLFGATLLKGVRMINDATRNRLAVSTREMLNTLQDPYFNDVPDGETATDTRSQTVVRYFENGVKKAYYAPKYVGHFIRGDNPWDSANNAMEVLRKYTAVNVWKRLQTMWSLRFMTTQPIADAKAWNTQMPGVRTPIGNVARGKVIGGLAQMLPASTWYLPASVFPPNSRERLMRPAREVIRKFYRNGEIDPRLRDLIERGMSDLNGAFNGVSRADPDAGEILQLFAGIKPSKALEVYAQDLNLFQRGWQKLEALPAMGRLFKLAGATAERLQSEMQVETLANKLAGMEYLDAKYPQMSEREKRSWVLHSAGNPNFAARAGADPFVDTLAWTFYNPAKEGYRSVAMAAKADPAGFMARAMWFNVAPNLIKWGAKSGVLYAVADALIPHGDTPEDEEDRKRYMDALNNWLGWFKRLPSYYGRRWVSIPLAPIGADSVFFIKIPQAQSLAPINGITNAMLDELAQLTGRKDPDNKFAERMITSVTDEIAGLNFLSGSNRSAFVQVFGPIIEMLTTDKANVYDPFYGRNILDLNEEQLMAGGRFTMQAWPAWQKLGKNAWNNAFGSALYRFDIKTPRADMPLKTELQKILTAPGVSTLVGGLIGVTGGGEFERMQDMFSAEGQNRAYDNVLVRKAALETLNDPQRRFPEWAAQKYTDDPKFQKDWNEYLISHDIYSGMSVEEKALYGRGTPVWKRMMLLRDKQNRSQ